MMMNYIYHDNGVIGNKRFITGFNPTLFIEDRNNRDEKITFLGLSQRRE
ncbi:MAG: hypothetical protein HS127_01225 [Planctomycetia bacterium]|nr:hypothetical protein [Planctomycetia bacterium]